MARADILAANGLTDAEITGGTLAVHTPIDGAEIARLKMHSAEEVGAMIAKGVRRRRTWAAWSPSNAARSCKKVSAKCRR
jgi:aldehyde dehydrogenase (NAD+)